MNKRFTHRLKHSIPELNLKEGQLLRQINPFAGSSPLDECLCFKEDDIKNDCRLPWVFYPHDLESLPEWEEIRQDMINSITNKQKPQI